MKGGMHLSLTASELAQEWGRCGLTADWLSAYLVLGLDPALRETAKNVVSTVANELLENAAKFSTGSEAVVEVSATTEGDFVLLETRNESSEERARLLQETLADLGTLPADSLFAQRISTGGGPDAPGVGLIIIRRDYGASIAADVTAVASGARNVRVVVRLPFTSFRAQ